MKRLTFLLALFLSVLPVLAQERVTEDFQNLVREALQNNPEIKSEFYRAQMLAERIPQVRSLDDPQFTYSLMEFPGTQFGEARFQNFGLMQMIMFPTKLGLRGDIASIDAQVARHVHSEKSLEVVVSLKSTYAMVWASRTNLKINRENQKLLEQILRVAQTQYSVGKGSFQDVLRTNIELDKTRIQEASLQQEVIQAESMLRAILNRQSGTIGEVAYPPFFRSDISLDRLLTHARDSRPMLLADSLGIEQAGKMISMMRQEYIPDFSIGIERVTMPVARMNLWSVMAGISIPFTPWSLGKASARVQEAMAEKAMRTSMLTASQNMVEAQIRDAFAKVQSYALQTESFERAILPQSLQSFEGLLADYQTGRTSYIMLIDGYRMYQEMRMDATMARMKYEQAIAELERQSGIFDFSELHDDSKEIR